MKHILTRVCIVFIILFNIPIISNANVGTLVECSKSVNFSNRMKESIKKLERRVTKYKEGTPSALALLQQINVTKERFERFDKFESLCGNDGLPHLVLDGTWKHSQEFIQKGALFFYITGWIGWSGRQYLKPVPLEKNPYEKEIMPDISHAFKSILSGYLWPLLLFREIKYGTFLVNSEDITISPR